MENGEKLFTAHLRFPPVAKSELRYLIETFSREKGDLEAPDASKERQSPTENAPGEAVARSDADAHGIHVQTSDAGSSIADTAGLGDAVIAGRAGLVTPSPARHLSDDAPVSTRVLEKAEIDAILAALDSATTVRSNLGPRAIRAFLFRYQLARLLLTELKIPWDADALATSLVARGFGSSVAPAAQPISADLTDAQKLQRVVDQVC